MKSSLRNPKEVSQALIGEHKIREDVGMYSQLPGYDRFGGFDLSNESDLAPISKRIYEEFAKQPRLILKHHLFSSNIPKKLFKSISEISLNDKRDGFKQERFITQSR